MLSEKYVIKIDSIILLTYSLISIYFILKYENITMPDAIINSGIDVIFFIPIYVIIVAITFSFKMINKSYKINK